jgi:hypothetical protein
VGEDEFKEVHPNLRGMIRYTYFEDYALFKLDGMTRKQLM